MQYGLGLPDWSNFHMYFVSHTDLISLGSLHQCFFVNSVPIRWILQDLTYLLLPMFIYHMTYIHLYTYFFDLWYHSLVKNVQSKYPNRSYFVFYMSRL